MIALPASPAYQTHQFLADESATLQLGHTLAAVLEPGMMIWLDGDLGAGKTTFVRGLLRGFGFAGKVKSPTYALVEVYNLFKLDIYHFDLYRFKNALEWEESGFSEDCNANSICLVEWPEKAVPLLPSADLLIVLIPDAHGRAARLMALTAKGEMCLRKLPHS